MKPDWLFNSFEHNDSHLIPTYGRRPIRRYAPDDYNKHQILIQLLKKILASKKLKILFLLIIISVLAILVALIVFLTPIILKLITYVENVGWKEIINSISSTVQKLLNNLKLN